MADNTPPRPNVIWVLGDQHRGQALSCMGDLPSAPDSAYIQSVIPAGHGDSVDRSWRGVVMANGWKYVALEGQPWLLFDTASDPYEQVNLAHNTRYRAERAKCHHRLAAWIDDTGDQFALPEL